MADEATTTTVSTENAQATEATANAAPATGDATGTNSGNTERTFTQADLDRIIDDRLKQERGKAEKAAAKAQADAEAKVLAEQGKYKELYDKQQAELQTAQAEAKAAATKLLQRDVAAKVNLPLPLAERLRGETADEMEADANTLLAAMPKPAAPNINANSGAGGAPAVGQMSDAEKRELAARLNVNPKYMT
jgi:hypothetical protein